MTNSFYRGLFNGLLISALIWALLGSIAYAGTAFYVREQISGLYKVCYYNYLGSEVAITVKSHELCPRTIQVK